MTDNDETLQIEVTPEMIDAGIGILIDYEIGGVKAGEAVRLIFISMLSASSRIQTKNV